MATEELNNGMNVNRARGDKFQLILSNIPSTPLMMKSETDILERDRFTQSQHEFVRLGLQSTELPSYGTSQMPIPTMFGVSVSQSNNVQEVDTLTTTFRMDENYTLYKMFWLWIMLINDPEKANQFYNYKANEVTQTEAYLIVKDNFNTPVLAFRFVDLQPMLLPAISLEYTAEGIDIDFPVTWMYSYCIPVKPNLEPYDTVLDI